MRDFSWLDVDALTGFDDEVRELLATHTKLPNRRIEAAARRVRENVRIVSRQA